MATPRKIPGVHIVEPNAFPSSVVAVPTAVPAFVGYTEQASLNGQSLTSRPFRVTSMSEFIAAYGGPPPVRFKIDTAPPASVDAGAAVPTGLGGESDRPHLTPVATQYLLYHSMLLFFQNGGGSCWIVSVGNFGDDIAPGDADTPGTLLFGLEKLRDEREPTIVVIPDAVRLAPGQCSKVQQEMLAHCGEEMNRFAILDIVHGEQGLRDAGTPVDAFRDSLGPNYLDYGAAYYPWLNTSLVAQNDISYRCFIDPADAGSVTTLIDVVRQGVPDWNATIGPSVEAMIAAPLAGTPEEQEKQAEGVNQTLLAVSPGWNALAAIAARKLNLMPPAAAMAGVYTAVDNARGVWKAPANVAVNGVMSPAVAISDDELGALTDDPAGRSINAIRAFAGVGVLAWGARTLDGNSLDWRYINVRRTMIFLEESCRLAARTLVFEPNSASTWVTVRSMISNFLETVWRQGGLAGAVPADAYSVHCGLGETMTAEDILEGNLRVTVRVAIIRPAEFIEITFQQQMQKS